MMESCASTSAAAAPIRSFSAVFNPAFSSTARSGTYGFAPPCVRNRSRRASSARTSLRIVTCDTFSSPPSTATRT
jgi:hypothetical protein